MKRISRFGRLLSIGLASFAVISVGSGFLGAADTAEEATSWGPGTRSEIDAERELHRQARQLAARGDIEGSWELISEASARLAPSPALVGWRAVSIVGSLRNESHTRQAHALAKMALQGGWTNVRDLDSKREQADALYWATILAESVGDRAQASLWVEEAADVDPESDRINRVRVRIERSLREFPQS